MLLATGFNTYNKMKIDFDHWRGSQIADEIQNNLSLERTLMLISALKPEFNQDGNMYCYTYPNREGLPNDCIQGFGATPYEAMNAFANNFYTQKAVVVS